MAKLVFGTIDQLPDYAPANHEKTSNKRLLGPFNGSNDVEIILGNMEKGSTANTHTHDNFDQIAIILEGELQCTTPDEDIILKAGDFLMIPRGTEHTVLCHSDKAKFFVVYAPPMQRLDK